MKLNKEVRWLIIFAVISLMLGLAISIVVSKYNKPFPHDLELTELYGQRVIAIEDEEFTTTDVLTKKQIIKNANDEVVGYVYTATSTVAQIPGSTESELTYQVLLTKEGKLVGMVEVENTHTQSEDFFLKYEETLENAKDVDFEDFTIDLQSGATESHKALTEILKAIKIAEGLIEEEPTPSVTELTAIEEIFGQGAVATNDILFITTEEVTKKEIVKDAEGNLLGYAYTATGNADTDIPGKGKGSITLLVGVDLDGKIKGVYTTELNHTPGFYNKYNEALENLAGVDMPDAEVDIDTTASISGRLINELLNAVKLAIVEESKTVAEKMFGEGAVAEVDETFEGNEIVTQVEKVKDAEGNVIGYIYTATGLSDKVLHPNAHNEKETITLLVGVNFEDKVQGVIVLETNHTPNFFSRHLAAIRSFVDVEFSEAQVDATDGVSGATISARLINELINAVRNSRYQ